MPKLDLEYNEHLAYEKKSSEVMLKPKKQKTKTSAYYLTLEDRARIIAETNDACLILFEGGYLERARIRRDNNGVDFDDKTMARIFGWSVQKAQRARLLLVKKGYIFTEKAMTNSGVKIKLTFIGKEAVAQHLGRIKMGLTIRESVCSVVQIPTNPDGSVDATDVRRLEEEIHTEVVDPSEPSDAAKKAFE